MQQLQIYEPMHVFHFLVLLFFKIFKFRSSSLFSVLLDSLDINYFEILIKFLFASFLVAIQMLKVVHVYYLCIKFTVMKLNRFSETKTNKKLPKSNRYS